MTPGVPEALAQLRAKRRTRDPSRPPLIVTIYDNGVPIIEAPWERLRSQPLDVWRSNGTLNGTLSWYSLTSYGLSHLPPGSTINDPWTSPYPVPFSTPNGSRYVKDPAGWGWVLYPPQPSERTGEPWSPVESVRWVMTGAGIQDSECPLQPPTHTPSIVVLLLLCTYA